MGTKNNPKNRAKKNEKLKYNGKEIEPIFYHGVHAGHGKYMAAKYSGTSNLVVGSSDKPLSWKDVAAMSKIEA